MALRQQQIGLDLNTPGRSPIQRRLAQITDPDAVPLMAAWMKIAQEGNQRGIMAGLDGAGSPMVPVRYRPAPYGKLGRVYKRRRPDNPGVAGNLTSRQYRLLDGPPLAPRGAGSRVITNYKTDFEQIRPGKWQVTYWWDDVVNRRGEPFLRYHFAGAGRLPKRDLRGVRPADQEKMLQARKAWMVDQLRSFERASYDNVLQVNYERIING